MKVFFYTDKGPNRETNQDGLFIAGKIFTCMDGPMEEEYASNEGFFATLDGIGGEGGGEIATAIILNILKKWVPVLKPSGAAMELLLPQIALYLRDAGAQKPELGRMGAVLGALWLAGDAALAINCGDARVYQCMGGFLRKLSHDHSAVQQLVDAGLLEEKDMGHHPRKNIVTSAISADRTNPRVFCRQVSLRSPARFFICSDGIWETFSLEALEGILGLEPGEAARLLAMEANQAGARDNFSFIIVDCGGEENHARE